MVSSQSAFVFNEPALFIIVKWESLGWNLSIISTAQETDIAVQKKINRCPAFKVCIKCKKLK